MDAFQSDHLWIQIPADFQPPASINDSELCRIIRWMISSFFITSFHA